VDELLLSLKSEVSSHSHGQFTVDARRTLEKMARFQLPKPQSYVQCLVAASVASGASFLKLYSDADDTILESDGCPFERGPLAELFAYLVDSSPDRQALKELAMGLLGVRSLAYRWVTVTCADAEGAFELRMTDSRLELKDVKSRLKAPVSLRIHVKESLGQRTMNKFLSKSAAFPLDQRPESQPVQRTPEIQEVARHCRFSPIPIELNGQPLRPEGLAQLKKIVFFQPPPDHGRTPLLLSLVPPTRGVITQDFWAMAAWGWKPPRSLAVVNGVDFAIEAPGLEKHGYSLVLYSDALQKDLSQTQVVRNEKLASMLRLVQAGVGL
jgi:hypothetical protein